MNRLRGTFLANLGPVWLWLGTCPPLSAVTLAAGQGPSGKAWHIPLPESGSQRQWGRWAQNLGENLGPRGHGVQRRLRHGGDSRALGPPLPQTGPSARSSLCLGILDQETRNLHKNSLAHFPPGSTHTANGPGTLGACPPMIPKPPPGKASAVCGWPGAEGEAQDIR